MYTRGTTRRFAPGLGVSFGTFETGGTFEPEPGVGARKGIFELPDEDIFVLWIEEGSAMTSVQLLAVA